MPASETASCILIGDAGVTLRCGELLRAHGLRLDGVVTGDPRLLSWAARLGIRCHLAPPDRPLGAEALAALSAEPFDYLFSVHNARVLTPEALAMARRAAVNYHDAPLPSYAGLHATSWALARREPTHGITWHRMAERVDAGEVLLRRSLILAQDETAATLNARCTEAAIDSFPDLLTLLQTGADVFPEPPSGAPRTWFGAGRRFVPGGVLDWRRTAEEIEAQVRALDFGPSDQPLALPKVLAPVGVFVVRAARVCRERSDLPPGTVCAIAADGARIATADADLHLAALCSLDGAPVQTGRHAEALGLEVGARLESAPRHATEFGDRERTLAKAEPAWRERLAELAPLAPAFLDQTEPDGTPMSDAAKPALFVPREPVVTAEGEDAAERLIARALAWLRHEVSEPFDVAFGEPARLAELRARGWTQLLQSRPPLRLGRAGAASVAMALRESRAERQRFDTYLLDLPLRARRVRERLAALEPPVALDVVAGPDEARTPWTANCRLGVTVDLERHELRFECPALAAMDAERGLRMATRAAARCAEFLARERAPRNTTVRKRGGSPPPVTVFELFAERARARPELVALELGGASVTYAALHARALRLGAALRRRGVGPESVVAIRAADGGHGTWLEVPAAMLGVLAAGAAFLILDPSDPPDREEQVIARARPAWLLGQASAAASRHGVVAQPLALAEACESGGLRRQEPAVPTACDLAYLAFTSGSSGEPKAVAIEHATLLHYVEAARDFFALGPGDRLLQLGSLAFDLAYEQVFVALASGATLVGLEQPELPSTRDLLAACARLRLTALDLPTAVFERTASNAARLELQLSPEIRLVIAGGEKASTPAALWWRTSGAPGMRLLNTYGPTETTIVATWWEAPARVAELSALEAPPIGRPIPGAEVAVLGEDLLPVAPGTAGELWIGGAGLARGYHRRPDLTAGRFRELPRVPGGGRFYRSGDRVRVRDDGNLEFLGRVDRQLKIAGRRVEPAEVEAALRRIPGVRDAAVAGIVEGTTTQLAAWIVVETAALTPSALRAECARSLPSAHCPARIVLVDELPRARSGKVDGWALRAPAHPVPQGEPPEDATERALAAIWRTVLGPMAVARGDDFFALGGDSLAAVELLAEIEIRLARRLGMADLLRAPTLAALAARVCAEEPARNARSASVLVPLQPDGTAPPLLCAHGLGGHLLRLVPLARVLAPDQPLFGLESPGLDDEAAVPGTIEELASIFLRAVRDRFGPAPLRLCGMSYGGIVAFEMARQALAERQEVAFLGMLDTDLAEVVPGRRPAAPSWSTIARQRLRRAVGDALGRVRRTARRAMRGEDEPSRANEYRHFSRVLRRNDASLRLYTPGAYRGPITFFAATTRAPDLYREFEYQTGCVLELVPVSGDHLGMLEPPHVEGLAGELRRRLPGGP